eukprot:576998-Rhodomonas_salina.3
MLLEFNLLTRETRMSMPVNVASHFQDASITYGFTKESNYKLRKYSGGRLKMDASGLYPQRDLNTRLFVLEASAGNSNPVLSSLITLFFREHNRRAAELAAATGR